MKSPKDTSPTTGLPMELATQVPCLLMYKTAETVLLWQAFFIISFRKNERKKAALPFKRAAMNFLTLCNFSIISNQFQKNLVYKFD